MAKRLWKLAWRMCQTYTGPFTVLPQRAMTYMVTLCVLTFAVVCQGADTSFVAFYFTSEPQDVIASKGEQLLLNCSAHHPSRMPLIQWIVDGKLISFQKDSHRYQLRNGSLYFNGIQHSRGTDTHTDKGIYRCMATVDSVGTLLSRSANLQIAHMAKVFDHEPTKFVPALYLGDTAIFRCTIKGKPRPVITWYRDGSRILPSSNVHTYHDGMLEISELQFRDFASYQCEARNSDRVRKSRSVTITQNPDTGIVYQRIPPKFVVTPEDTTPVLGTNAILHCAANGRDTDNKPPEITWLKDGVTINFKSEPRYTIIGKGTLRIIAVRETDSGTYTCRAQNAEDSVDADAKLNVLVPPSLVTKSKNMVTSIKSDVLLSCHVFGIPKPKVTWVKDGDPIKFDNYFQLVDGRSLRILGVMTSDAGVYQCFATNRLSTLHDDLQLAVTEPASFTQHPDLSGASPGDVRKLPTTPLQANAAIIAVRFVTLSWKQPKSLGNSAFIGYRVYWNEAGSARERVMNTTTPEANIQHLKPSTKYIFRIQSVNSLGGSPSMATLTLTTDKEVVVPGASQNLIATTLSSRSIKVTWQPPEQTHGKIIHYDLYYYKVADTSEHKTSVTSTTFVLNNLEPFTKYSFRVVAFNENGPGVNSEELEAQTYSDKPEGPPVNVTLEVSSTTSLIVRWDPPELENRNGVITGYKIRHKKRGVRRGQTVTTDGNRRTFALTDLDKNSEYMMKISALNVNGSGPVTEWLSAKTLRDDLDETRVPGQPTKLRARPLSNSIIVSWAPPADTSVMVRGYILGWGVRKPDVYEVDIEAKQLYYTIYNISPATEFVISVTAHNKMGRGRSKMETVITIDEPAPEPTTPMLPPVGLKAVVLSAKTILLTWTDTTLGRTQLINDNRYYTVRYTVQRKARYRYTNCTDLVAYIDDLKPNTPYEFGVKVIKGLRQSTWSLMASNTTWEAAPASVPRDVTPVPIDATSVMLNWQPPLRPNGQISGYLVFYTMDSTLDDAHWVLDGVLGDELSIHLRDLTPDTTYHFKVQARNKKGYGPMSPTVVYRTAKPDGTGGGKVDMPYGHEDTKGSTSRKDSEGPYGWNGKDEMKPIAGKTGKAAESDQDYKSTENGASEGKNEESGGLPTNVLIIIIACVIGITFIIVTAIITVVLCRRRADNEERKKHKSNIAYKSPANAIPKDQNPPDLWIVGDKGQGGGEGPASVSASSRNSQEVKSIDDMPPGMELLERRRNSFVSEQGYEPPRLEDRYVRPTPVRPKPMMIPVDSQMHREPVATVTALPNGHLIQNIPPDTIPIRPVYPRTQYNTQYTTPPRVHAGDVTQPSSSPDSSPYMRQTAYENPQSPTSSGSNSCNEGYRSLPKSRAITKNVSSSAQAPPVYSETVTKSSHIPKHIVKPQLPSSPFKKPDPPVSSTPLKTRSPKPPTHNKGSKTREEMQKSMSTEELSAEMANLEVLMKDLNDITQQEFQC